LELLPLLVAFVVTLLLIVALNPLAQRVGRLDKPDVRKQHKAAAHCWLCG
jgi:UDP-N-acetylmuramyl pentapeptide phosphotransferase/UDP-N-acetylglucosamine-1-phosphate transferase